jgi:hypothetical protein
MTLKSGKYRTENVAYPHVKRDYFRAKLTLTERKRCVNGKACKNGLEDKTNTSKGVHVFIMSGIA